MAIVWTESGRAHCERCGQDWLPATDQLPKFCAFCGHKRDVKRRQRRETTKEVRETAT